MDLITRNSNVTSTSQETVAMDDRLYSEMIDVMVMSDDVGEEMRQVLGEKYIAEFDDVRYFTFEALQWVFIDFYWIVRNFCEKIA